MTVATVPTAALFEIMATTRAMRRLRPDPVPDDLVRKLIEAAMWAPTAGDGQGQVFVVVTDRDRMRRLADIWRRAVDVYAGWLRRADPRFGSDPGAIRTFEAVYYQRDHFADTPLLIVACYDQRAFVARARRRVRELASVLRHSGRRRAIRMLLGGLNATEQRSEAASIYPAVQNLLLAARAHGLAATMSTWHLFYEADVKEILGIPKNVRTYALIPIGWPLGNFGPVKRRPIDDVIRRDHW